MDSKSGFFPCGRRKTLTFIFGLDPLYFISGIEFSPLTSAVVERQPEVLPGAIPVLRHLAAQLGLDQGNVVLVQQLAVVLVGVTH